MCPGCESLRGIWRAHGSVLFIKKVQLAAVAYPLPLRSDVVQLVQDVVTRIGLAQGIFTKEQEHGLGISATDSWEHKIRARTGRAGFGEET